MSKYTSFAWKLANSLHEAPASGLLKLRKRHSPWISESRVARKLRGNVGYDPEAIDADCSRHQKKLDDVETAFAPLDLGDERLRLAQPFRQLGLRKPSASSRIDHARKQELVGVGVD